MRKLILIATLALGITTPAFAQEPMDAAKVADIVKKAMAAPAKNFAEKHVEDGYARFVFTETVMEVTVEVFDSSTRSGIVVTERMNRKDGPEFTNAVVDFDKNGEYDWSAHTFDDDVEYPQDQLVNGMRGLSRRANGIFLR